MNSNEKEFGDESTMLEKNSFSSKRGEPITSWRG